MKKLLLFSFLLLTCSAIYSQNIEIAGKLSTDYPKETGKIYYAKQGGKFNPAVFITYDKKKNFVFKMSIAKIKKDNIKVIVFAIDPKTEMNPDYMKIDISKIMYNTQGINIGEIASSEEFSSLATIRLKTDLVLNKTSFGTPPPPRGERFIGDYHFELNDTLYKVKLEKYGRLSSSFSKATKDYMIEEDGSWDFDEKTKKLIFDIRVQTNKRYGLTIPKNYQLEFIVKELQNSMTFETKKGVLTKIK